MSFNTSFSPFLTTFWRGCGMSTVYVLSFTEAGLRPFCKYFEEKTFLNYINLMNEQMNE